MMRAIAPFLTALAVLLALAAAPPPAQAQALDELRRSGAIGERFDGFVAVRENVPGAAAIAAQVNAERRRIYAERARQQNITPAQVGMVYAQEIVRNAPAGTWFLDQGGGWRRK